MRLGLSSALCELHCRFFCSNEWETNGIVFWCRVRFQFRIKKLLWEQTLRVCAHGLGSLVGNLPFACAAALKIVALFVGRSSPISMGLIRAMANLSIFDAGFVSRIDMFIPCIPRCGFEICGGKFHGVSTVPRNFYAFVCMRVWQKDIRAELNAISTRILPPICLWPQGGFTWQNARYPLLKSSFRHGLAPFKWYGIQVKNWQDSRGRLARSILDFLIWLAHGIPIQIENRRNLHRFGRGIRPEIPPREPGLIGNAPWERSMQIHSFPALSGRKLIFIIWSVMNVLWIAGSSFKKSPDLHS